MNRHAFVLFVFCFTFLFPHPSIEATVKRECDPMEKNRSGQYRYAAFTYEPRRACEPWEGSYIMSIRNGGRTSDYCVCKENKPVEATIPENMPPKGSYTPSPTWVANPPPKATPSLPTPPEPITVHYKPVPIEVKTCRLEEGNKDAERLVSTVNRCEDLKKQLPQKGDEVPDQSDIINRLKTLPSADRMEFLEAIAKEIAQTIELCPPPAAGLTATLRVFIEKVGALSKDQQKQIWKPIVDVMGKYSVYYPIIMNLISHFDRIDKIFKAQLNRFNAGLGTTVLVENDKYKTMLASYKKLIAARYALKDKMYNEYRDKSQNFLGNGKQVLLEHDKFISETLVKFRNDVNAFTKVIAGNQELFKRGVFVAITLPLAPFGVPAFVIGGSVAIGFTGGATGMSFRETFAHISSHIVGTWVGFGVLKKTTPALQKLYGKTIGWVGSSTLSGGTAAVCASNTHAIVEHGRFLSLEQNAKTFLWGSLPGLAIGFGTVKWAPNATPLNRLEAIKSPVPGKGYDVYLNYIDDEIPALAKSLSGGRPSVERQLVDQLRKAGNRIPFEKVLPKPVAELLGKAMAGPNCAGAAEFFNKHFRGRALPGTKVENIHPSTVEADILEGHYRAILTGQDIHIGDLAVFFDKARKVQHVGVVMGFGKNGKVLLFEKPSPSKNYFRFSDPLNSIASDPTMSKLPITVEYYTVAGGPGRAK